MQGHPHPSERDPRSDQGSRWIAEQESASGPPTGENHNEILPGDPRERVRRENLEARSLSLRVVDNAIHFLKNTRLIFMTGWF